MVSADQWKAASNEMFFKLKERYSQAKQPSRIRTRTNSIPFAAMARSISLNRVKTLGSNKSGNPGTTLPSSTKIEDLSTTCKTSAMSKWRRWIPLLRTTREHVPTRSDVADQ